MEAEGLGGVGRRAMRWRIVLLMVLLLMMLLLFLLPSIPLDLVLVAAEVHRAVALACAAAGRR